MGLKPSGYWFLFSSFTNQSAMAHIYYIGGGKKGGKISQNITFGGIEGGEVINIKAVLSL